MNIVKRSRHVYLEILIICSLATELFSILVKSVYMFRVRSSVLAMVREPRGVAQFEYTGDRKVGRRLGLYKLKF